MQRQSTVYYHQWVPKIALGPWSYADNIRPRIRTPSSIRRMEHRKPKDKTCDINDAIHANVNLHNGTGTTARAVFILVKEWDCRSLEKIETTHPSQSLHNKTEMLTQREQRKKFHNRRRVVWIELQLSSLQRREPSNALRSELKDSRARPTLPSVRAKVGPMPRHPIITASSKTTPRHALLPTTKDRRSLGFLKRMNAVGRISDTPLQPITAGSC